MRILHSSDLHGNYHGLLEALQSPDWDVWCDTGDFFPNKTRGEVHVEVGHQTRWFSYPRLGSRLTEAMKGRPLVSVSGNHDYISLASGVAAAGGVAFSLTGRAPPIQIGGFRFGGFREIPWIEGEWAGETHRGAFNSLVGEVLSQNPNVLLTHAPPQGILDNDGGQGHGWGIEALTSSLFYTDHKVRAHFFGHIHQQGGKSETHAGIGFHNGATKITLIQM